MKHMKKSSIFLGILFLFCCLAALGLMPSKVHAENISVEAQSISWEITRDGVLRISGEGMIPNNYHPWCENRNDIVKITGISFEEGITRIGDYVTAAGDEERWNLFNVSSVSFPSTLKEIGMGNFRYMHTLKSIVFPDNLTSIESTCFEQCDSLERVSFPKHLEYIGTHCFDLCSTLKSIEFNNNLKIIGWGSFNYCKSLQTIILPQQIQTIGSSCFANCEALEEISIPASAETLEEGCFTNNKSLKRIAVDSQNNTYIVTDGVLYDYAEKTLLVYPLAYTGNVFRVPDNIERIGNNAFALSSSLQEIVLPSGLKSIGSSAFSGCTKLEKVVFPEHLQSIEWGAFCGCSSLKEINIPASITDIDENAFVGCSIKKIVIPDSVISIGKNAFDSSVIIVCNPNSYIDRYAQKNGYKVQYINGDNNDGKSISWKIEENTLIISGSGIIPNNYHPWCEDRSNIAKITSIIFEEGITRIGDYVTAAGDEERWNLFNVSSVSFPSTLKEIGMGNFRYMRTLKNIVFPDYLTSVESMCFEQCEALENITFPEYLEYIGTHCFDQCSAVKNIVFNNNLKTIGWGSFNYCKSLQTIILPQQIQTIGSSCFANCEVLEEISIPASAETLEEGCFTNNKSLKRIAVDSQNNTYIVTDGVLYDYAEKTLLVYPLAYTENVFRVPDNIERIGNNAFASSSSLQEVVLPSGLKSIGNGAFYNCENLKTITLPSSIKIIEDWAFANCASLKNISIPFGTEKIGYRSFEGCSIEKMIIPDSVTSIGENAFDPSVIIVCTPNSYTDRYAQKNGLSILYIDNHSQVYDYSSSTEQMKRWEKASAEFLEFIIKHINDDKSTFTHFVGIMVDGEHVSPENYSAEPGSLILRLKASYLETLSPGEHTLKAIFDDGDIEIPFLVDTEKAIDYTKFDDVAVPTDTFTFKKVWQGDHEDSIDFTLYQADGTVYHHGFDKRVVSKTEWKYNAYFSAPAACYVIEKPVPGYQIKYVNVGVYADITDRCCDGGTIINKKIPKTGDAADFALWAGIIALGVVGLATTVILTKRKRAHK